MTKSRRGEEFCITSLVSGRILMSVGNMVHTTAENDTNANMVLWNADFTSGELCYMSLSTMDMRVRCDIVGNLSLSKKCQGWEAWRFSEAGDGYVRISPWAHSEKLLSSDNDGNVSTTEEQRGPMEVWSVEKAPNGLYGY